jgi:hypothetical protein
MALGGFLGQDPAITPAGIARLVQRGEVRFFLDGGGFGGSGPGGFPADGPGGGFTFPGGSSGNGTPSLPQFPGGGLPPGGFGGRPGGRGFGGGPGGGTSGEIMRLVQQVCSPATGAVPTQYASRLYDCAGKGPALLAAVTTAG